MLSLDEALDRVLGGVSRLGAIRLPVAEAAARVLAEDVLASGPFPAFDTSAMDGYAVRRRDCRGSGAFRLRVVGESRAGFPFEGTLESGTCRIFTGGMLPNGADAVVIQEDVLLREDEIEFTSAPAAHQHVRRAGEDLEAGTLAIANGTRLNAFHLGLLASLDRTEVLVGAAPRVGVLATGSELRAPGEPGRVGSIPESNSVAVAALARQAGAVVVELRRVGDDLEGTERALAELLASCDVVVTIGGVSVGDYDVVKDALLRAGVALDFWKVAIKVGATR
jgi:molybdopterin molybdotransferase